MEKDPKERPQTAEMIRLWEDALVEADQAPEELRARPDGSGPECLHLAAVLAGDEDDDSATMTRTRYSGSYRGAGGGGLMRWLMFAVLAGGAAAAAFVVGKGQSSAELAKARDDAAELPRLKEADAQQIGKIADLEKRLADTEAKLDARGSDQAAPSATWRRRRRSTPNSRASTTRRRSVWPPPRRRPPPPAKRCSLPRTPRARPNWRPPD